MEKKSNKEKSWRQLDNSAKIFPVSAGKKYSTVFRYSVVLKENIKPKLLSDAVSDAITKFKYFRVKLQVGLFWHYLDYNKKMPVIEEESEYPCVYVDSKDSNDYLFRISYYKNKISVDYYHALCDGNSAIEFIKEITYRYLELSHPDDFKNKELRDKEFLKYEMNANDDYINNYDRNAKFHNKNELAYIIKGHRLPIDQVATIHEYASVSKVKEVAKKYDASITEYLTAVLIYAIYRGNVDKSFKTRNSRRPVKVCIPVNLRRFFKSKTVSNFFSYFVVIAGIKKEQLIDFDKTINFVKKEFKEKLTFEEIFKTMSALVKFGKNPILNYVILPIKILMARLGYALIRRYTTITFSNVGRFGVIKDYQDYIDHVLFMIAPEPVEKTKVSSISYKDVLTTTFTTNMIETDIEKEFAKILEEHGIEVAVETNNVIPINFKKECKNIPLMKTEYPDNPNQKGKIILEGHERIQNRKKKRANMWDTIRKRIS